MITFINTAKLNKLLEEKRKSDHAKELENFEKQNLARIRDLEETLLELNKTLSKKDAEVISEVNRRVNSVITNLLKQYYCPPVQASYQSQVAFIPWR